MDFLQKAAQEAPHLPALRTKQRTFSFLELENEVQVMEAYLRQQQLHAGDVLAVQLPTGSLFVSLLFASLRLGALFCPLNLRLPSIEIPLQQLSPKFLFSQSGCQPYSGHVNASLRSEILLFTSGTTGTPKIARLPQTCLENNARSAVERLDLREQDEWLLSLPLHHVGGLGIVFRCLYARATMSLVGCEKKLTHMSAVPTQLYRSWPTAKTLRCLLLGGAPIHETPKELPIVCSYGMTETASLIAADGKLLAGKEIQLIDREIWVRGDSLFAGYWGEKANNPSEWFQTKDMGLWDASGTLQITGRKDNQFICAGENIQPEEIEQALLQHPSCLDALVVPKWDPEYGARPIAFLRPLSGLPSLSSIQQFLADKLPKYKIPIAVDVLQETEFKPDRKKYFEKAQKISIF